MSTLDVIALGLLLVMVPAATAFPILYAWQPWSSEAVGRALMLSSVGLALLVDFAVLYRLLDGEIPPGVRVVVYLLIAVGMYYQLFNLVRAQRRRRRRRRRVSDPGPTITEEGSTR